MSETLSFHEKNNTLFSKRNFVERSLLLVTNRGTAPSGSRNKE